MAVPRGMAVWHPLVKVGACAKIVNFCVRVRTKYIHPVGTVKSHDIFIYVSYICLSKSSVRGPN